MPPYSKRSRPVIEVHQNESPEVLNVEPQLRSAFQPSLRSAVDISKSQSDPVQAVVALAQPKIKNYGRQVELAGQKTTRCLIPCLRSRIELVPDDILVEIFKTLGWKEVLGLRQTCKRFQEISKVKVVWLSQMQQLSFVLPVSPRLEDHRDAYTAQELEHFVLSRISAHIGWLSGKTPQRTDIPSSYKDPDYYAMVEGGRWLLVLDDGCVYAQDLDAPLEREPQLLFDTQNRSLKSLWCSLQVDIDYNEPTLTFNLSLLPLEYVEDAPTLQIYRVHLTGHGKDARLVSKLLNHFTVSGNGSSEAQDLSGKYFARAFYSSRSCHIRTEVFDWTLSNETTHCVTSIDSIPVALAILPGSKLLCCSYDSTATIYNIGKLSLIDSNTFHRETTTEILWHYEFASPFYCRFLSTPSCGPFNSTRITISNGQRVFGIIIPQNNISPTIHLLSEGTPYTLFASSLGINKMFSQSAPGITSVRFNFIWPDDESISSCPSQPEPLYLRSQPFDRINCPVFDESSGRVVCMTETGWTIFDLAFPQ